MDVLVFLCFHWLLNVTVAVAVAAGVARIGQLKASEPKIHTESTILAYLVQFLDGVHWLCSGGGMVVTTVKSYIWMKKSMSKSSAVAPSAVPVPAPNGVCTPVVATDAVRKRPKILPPPLPASPFFEK
jgi:hypothetical protein